MTHTLNLTEDEIYVLTLALFRWMQIQSGLVDVLFSHSPTLQRTEEKVRKDRMHRAEKLFTQLEDLLLEDQT